jgi:transposase
MLGRPLSSFPAAEGSAVVHLGMPRGVSDKIRFKPYDQHEQWLLPPSADELVPQGHLVSKVGEAIDELDLEGILVRYTKGGGASRYHPVMLLKVPVYGYMAGTYSSRHLARAPRENVMFMWLAGTQKPDFRTINTFRGKSSSP